MSENIKQVVGPNKYVAYTYKLTDAETGEVLFEAKADAPDEMIYGVSRDVVPGLIAAMKDLGAGDRFEITLPPAAAFGDSYPDNIVTLDRQIFERDGQLADEVMVGALLPMMTAEGIRIQGKVLEITDQHIRMDFNHPFAGKTVTYAGEVLEVRDATPEEIKGAEGCGCGCGGGCCGGEGHCDSDGCGCSSDGDNCGCKGDVDGKEDGCGCGCSAK